MRKRLNFLLIFTLIATMLLPVFVSAAPADPTAGTVTTASGSLNVRTSGSTDAPVAAFLSKGSYITLISKSGYWWYVQYGKNQYGYCHGNYITSVPSSAAAVTTQSSRLNVRSGPGTSYAVLGSLANGENVIVLSSADGWSRVLYYGTKTGYVSSQYLSSTGAKRTDVALNVPSYKQADSRWENVKLGNSGKTIHRIGCATTAIAMIESYRTGKTVYPDAMSKKLSYTASGSVYWPSDYVPVTNASGYLNGIYEQLKLGKPVLFGGKTAAGGQHWVVITGYTGGDTLTASGFTINDPGSNTRTNLQQFLNNYPIFYKYFYYK